MAEMADLAMQTHVIIANLPETGLLNSNFQMHTTKFGLVGL